jgi:hypothetical protein
MRTILVVVVITSAACLEPLDPAPQTPVSTGIEEHTTSPPVGRLKVGKAQGTVQPIDVERTFGPVIASGPVTASGTDAGRSWSLRGRIDARGAAIFLETSTGGGGGGIGVLPLPFQDQGWKKLGHFGGFGWGEHPGRGAPGTFTLRGVVSKQTAAIEVRLADGTSLPAQIIDTGDPRASFFVAVWSAPDWEVMIARDATGAELETFRPYRQPPTQATPTRANATSTP